MTDERKELLERAHELATYIHQYPAERDLILRTSRLTGLPLGSPDLYPIVEEVERWLEKFKEGKL
jgi:hypothetical protein